MFGTLICVLGTATASADVTVVVIDGATKKPVQGAVIYVDTKTGTPIRRLVEGKTDEDGRFVIDEGDLDASLQELFVSALTRDEAAGKTIRYDTDKGRWGPETLYLTLIAEPKRTSFRSVAPTQARYTIMTIWQLYRDSYGNYFYQPTQIRVPVQSQPAYVVSGPRYATPAPSVSTYGTPYCQW